MAAGADGCGHHPPYHHQGHRGRGCHGRFGAERHDTGKTDLSSQGAAGEIRREYEKVSFFDPDSSIKLASLMKKIIENEDLKFDKNDYIVDKNLFCKNWSELFDIILKKE